MFKEEREKSNFKWEMIGDIGLGRPNLGDQVDITVYRLMQFTLRDIIIREFDVETADKIFFEAGKKAGQEYYRNIMSPHDDINSMFAELQTTMRELGIGIFRVESADYDTGSFVVTVAEDLDCSGLPVYSEEICTYDEGFIAGILLEYSGDDFNVEEIDCWCSGGRVCRFNVDRA